MAYQNDPSQGSGLLGRVFTALGQGAPDIRRGTLIQDAELPYRNLFHDYTSSLAPQKAGLQDFTTSYKSLTPQLAALDQLHSSIYGDLTKQAQNYDPTRNLQTSGDYLFGNLDKYLNRGLQAGTAGMNQALAASGYGDRAPGGYSALLNANRITSNLLPAFSNIVSNLTPLTAQQNSDYFRNLAQIPGFMEGQTNALQATPFRALVPSQIQQGQLAGNLGLLNNLTQGEMANSYFYNQPNGWAKLGNVFSGLYGGIFDAADAANKVASAYGNVMTSGLGSQGAGGVPMGGSGGAGGAGGIGGIGGLGGGAGGMNVSQILGLLGQVRGQQQAQPNLGGGLPYNTGQFPGEQGWNPVVAQSPASIYNPALTAPPAYAGYGIGYSQNPYSQYGAYFPE